MLIQRIWTRSDNKLQTDTDKTLQIWDSGSTRYERITEYEYITGYDHITRYEQSSDTETHWKVIERVQTDSGFTETLSELPAHLTPTEFTWKEESPVRILDRGTFEVPGWKVETKILKS